MTPEQLRQHYLEAMGIESYVPRWPLPGAAPSPLLDLPLSDEPGDETEEVGGKSGPMRPDVVALASELRQSSASRPRLDVDLGTEESKPRAVPTEAPAVRRSLRFTLNVWQISQHILVLDSRRDLALPVGRLLHNMVLALGLTSEELVSAEPFRWPLSELGLSSKQGEEEARAALQAFVAARLPRQPLSHILLMGGPAVRFALPPEQLEETSVRALMGTSLPLNIDGASLEAIVLPSLANILQYPEFKATVWAAIKHLRKPRV